MAKPSKKKASSGKTKAKKAATKKAATKKAATKKAATKKAVGKKRAATSRGTKKPVATTKRAVKKAVKKPAKRATTADKPSKKAAKKTAKKAAGKRAQEKTARTDGRTSAGRGQVPKLKPLSARAHKAGVALPPPAPASSKRNFGLRGAAPWVARHAAKRAEELRRRNAEPPPPGSARATLRVPPQAEQIKSQIAELHQLMSKVRGLRKRFDRSFYEIGEVLCIVQRKQLHEAKGYSSFDSFLEREVDLPRSMSLRLIRVVQTFQRETAYDFGVERLTAALSALDGELTAAPASQPHPSSRGFSSTTLPPKPPIRFEE
ncbi:MAG: hypothetical protein DRI90_02550 [Deltaproteobacteria bacterium]|nr:MAG: hypothetical protein DRI90_02550 [Deltaproteobacteria bacterium]